MKLIFLIILYLSFIFIFSYGFENSTYGTNNYNLELDVLNEGKQLYHTWSNSDIKRKNLLCVVFTSFSHPFNNTIINNIHITKDSCDWAIILYDGDENEICNKSIIKNYTKLCKRNNESYHKSRILLNGKELELNIPKTVLYSTFIDLVPNYNYIMLLDEDISLKNFTINNFFDSMNCVTDYPPMVTQPIIYESTQLIMWANRNKWVTKSKVDIIGHESIFIEQQVPIFDARFFQWFAQSIVSRVRSEVLKYGSDWGQDRTWCAAAKSYSQYVLNYPSDYIPCMLYPRSGYVHHLNGKTISVKKTYFNFFQRIALKSVQAYINLFPTWVITRIYPDANIFTNESKFKQFYIDTTKKFCSSDIFIDIPNILKNSIKNSKNLLLYDII